MEFDLICLAYLAKERYISHAKVVSFKETKNSLGSVLMVEGTIAMSEVGHSWGSELARDTSWSLSILSTVPEFQRERRIRYLQ